MKCRLKQRVMRLAAHALLMNVMGLSQLAKATENNVHLTGALVAQPCVIPPGEENIPVEFGTVVDKYLYANERTKSEEFAIHLTECDPDVAQRVKVTFGGTPNTALPGLLALDGGSEAKGVALGLETEDGTALVLNENTTAVLVTEGEMQLRYRAYVQGEPAAIAAHSIGLGEFRATATFSLEYE
ncbi:TPA: type 1 fimbrial protein [Enterobacter bugandensis]|nr:type 1 fimbrial protein [Enterobacter bugandensis]